MDNMQEVEYKDVFLELYFAIKDKMLIICGVFLLFAGLGWLVSTSVMDSKYEASVNMIVNTRSETGGTITNDNISSAQNLADTYAIIIKSNIVLNRVIKELSLDSTYVELAEQVSVESINNTQVMRVSARHSDAELAEKIVATITNIAPDIVKDAVEAGSCKIVSEVTVSDKPVSPSTTKIMILSAMLGTMLYICGLILKELFHDYIVDDSDIANKLGIPVLGVIPEVEK